MIGKGDKEREVPLGDLARDAVAAWLPARGVLGVAERDELFTNRRVARSAHATSDGLWDDTRAQPFRAGG